MSRLTLRILAGFFLSLLLLATASITITAWWIRGQAVQLEERQSQETEQAALALAAGGPAGLRDWARRQAERRDGGPVFLVIDDWGDDLLGRPVKDLDWPPLDSESTSAEGDAQWPSVMLAVPPPLPVLVSEDEERFQLLALSPSTDAVTFEALTRTAAPQLLLALLVLLLASAVLARSITRPVLQLERVADSLARGTLSARAPAATASRRDELGVLARTFDRMAERLARLLRSREQLLQDISHELRSPLSRLRMAVGLLRQSTAPSVHVERIETEIAKLDHLITQVLDVARLDAGAEWLRRESLDLARLIDPLIADARFEGLARQCTILWTPSAVPLPIQGDEDWTSAAIENVLRNALRHTATDSTVTVEVREDAEQIELTVTDQGPGVPAEHLERIFEPFHRVDPARSTAGGGAGLGLAIAARVLHAHGGTIAARNRSNAEGMTLGLEVTLRWPRRKT
jgi:two-component system sensor histidine kinase CpxA